MVKLKAFFAAAAFLCPATVWAAEASQASYHLTVGLGCVNGRVVATLTDADGRVDVAGIPPEGYTAPDGVATAQAKPEGNGHVDIAQAKPEGNGHVDMAQAKPEGNGHIDIAQAKPDGNGHVDIALNAKPCK